MYGASMLPPIILSLVAVAYLVARFDEPQGSLRTQVGSFDHIGFPPSNRGILLPEIKKL